MSETKLTDAELARLEELAELYLSGNALPFAESDYRESSCNAVPSLVAEVRRLRAENEQMKHGMTAAYMVGKADGGDLQAENAALRERVEALEWLREVEAYALDASIFELRQGAIGELENTYDAARESAQ